MSAVCLHQVETGQPLRLSLEPGSMAPLHAGATGRVLLAYALPEIVEAVIARGLEQVTPDTPKEAVLRATLVETSRGRRRPQRRRAHFRLCGIAAPIFQDDGIVGAVGSSGPSNAADSPGALA